MVKGCLFAAFQAAIGRDPLHVVRILQDSASWLRTQRDTDLPALMRDKQVAKFPREASSSTPLGTPWPKPSGYMATEGFEHVPLCFHKQGGAWPGVTWHGISW